MSLPWRAGRFGDRGSPRRSDRGSARRRTVGFGSGEAEYRIAARARRSPRGARTESRARADPRSRPSPTPDTIGESPFCLTRSRMTEMRIRRNDAKGSATPGTETNGRSSHGATRRSRRTGTGALGTVVRSPTTISAPPSKRRHELGDVLRLIGEIGLHEQHRVATRIARLRDDGTAERVQCARVADVALAAQHAERKHIAVRLQRLGGGVGAAVVEYDDLVLARKVLAGLCEYATAARRWSALRCTPECRCTARGRPQDRRN